MNPSCSIERLIEVMAALRDPDTGCPWDQKQTFATIAPYTIEEAYEVADAIQRGDAAALRDELGDLLLQVVYHSRMAEEAGDFVFGDVVMAITEKMIRRHPHVFGDADSASFSDKTWDQMKAVERESRSGASDGILDDVPLALPSLSRAQKLQRRAASLGFDWSDWGPALQKVKEETAELEAELSADSASRTEEELGDLLFSVVNVARHVKLDAEAALRRANERFASRVNGVSRLLYERGRSLVEATPDELDEAWRQAKASEAGPSAT